MTSTLFFLVMAFVLLVAVIALLRSRKLREKYAALWIVVTVLVVVLAIFPGLLEFLAGAVGIVVPSNLLFALALLLLLGVSLHLSLEVSRLDDETRVLSEEVGILRLQIHDLVAADLLRDVRTDSGAGPDGEAAVEDTAFSGAVEVPLRIDDEAPDRAGRRVLGEGP